jgi:hypothetical protein
MTYDDGSGELVIEGKVPVSEPEAAAPDAGVKN